MDTVNRLNAALVGRYEIERELGAGGMAIVYLARDLRHHRKVALKVMRPELAANLGIERFLREIHTAAQLQHPHILPLHDSGEADGFLFFVMPFVEGESLRSRLERDGELPVAEAVRLLRDVADALAHAHAHGVVHRDIKPDNVLLSGRHAIITDFGVAKAVSESTGRMAVTTLGVALGTPTYMAPEQAAADPHVDHRADIYAWGILAYELLTGKPPFIGSAQQVLAAQITQSPEPLIARRAAVPAPLDATVLKALEKKPADRWQTAGELVTQLESVMTPTSSTPVGSPPMTTASAAAPASRPKMLVAAGILVLAIGVIGGWLATRKDAFGSEPRRIVVLPPTSLAGGGQADVADGIVEEINNRLVSLPGIEVIGRSSAERYRDTKLTPRQIGDELHATWILALRVGSRGASDSGRLRVSAELVRAATEAAVWGKPYQVVAAADNIRMQADIVQEVASKMGVAVAADDRARLAARPTDDQEAYDEFLRGMPLSESENVTELVRAVGHLERAVARDPKFAAAWAALASSRAGVYWFSGFTPRDLEAAKRAGAEAEKLAPDSPKTQFALGTIAYWGHLDYDRALEHINRAVAADPGRSTYLFRKAAVQRRSGQFEAALETTRRAHALDPRDPRPLGDGLGGLLNILGRPAEGLVYADSAVALEPDEWIGHHNVILAWLQQGKFRDADSAAFSVLTRRPGLSRMLQLRPRQTGRYIWMLTPEHRRQVAAAFPAIGPDFRDTAAFHLAHGDILSAAGLDSHAAYELAAQSWERRVKALPEGRATIALAYSYLGLGRGPEAIATGKRAVELQSRDKFEGPDSRIALAKIYLQFGKPDLASDEAEAYIRAAPGLAQVMRFNPEYAALRELPRIRALLAEKPR